MFITIIRRVEIYLGDFFQYSVFYPDENVGALFIGSWDEQVIQVFLK